jgi:5-methyltetrahydropteroyltriglutamate--homocysteine methyltransferase
MKLNTDRILTTHVGSLPRTEAVCEILLRKENNQPYEQAEFDKIIHQATVDVVKKQVSIGIDIVSDGETSKIGYATYIKDRLTGFGGENTVKPHLDMVDHPNLRKRMVAFTGPQSFKRLCCTSPITLRDAEAVKKDIATFQDALKAANDGTRPVAAFMDAASPGVVSSFQPNQFYPTHEKYIEALAEALQPEYEAIAAAGFFLQLDCPDLAMSRHTGFQDLSEVEFLKRISFHIDVLNHALRNVPGDKMRMHICWGNYEGPHDHDIGVEKIMSTIFKAKPQYISFEAANPRHQHEWAVWRDAKIPDNKVLMPGMLDTSTNFVEHPELVAQRIERFANIVGRERVIASTDCGFGTFAGHGKVEPEIAFKKLKSLAEGAAIASQRLWK